MINLNRVLISGFLGSDPETKKAGNSTVTRFSIAVNDRWTDNEGERQERTHWIPVVAWNSRGENAAKFIHKGSHVLVEGSLSVSSWDDKESGDKRSKTEVVASQIIFLDRKSES